MESTYTLHAGTQPLLVSFPHCGTSLPAVLWPRLTAEALDLPDTDWHLPELYDFLSALGVYGLVPRYSRYLIDLNRDPAGQVLYPGASNSELCPLTTFADAPIYRAAQEPDAEEIEQRLQLYWQPYHAALQQTLAALRARHGYAILFEAHSIASQVPRFFAGQLPDFNFGTDSDTTLPAPLTARLQAQVQADGRYSSVVNGRFKGGYITRHYAAPAQRIYSLQLELSQRTYMIEDGAYRLDAERAAAVRPLLRAILQGALDEVAALS